MPAAVERKTEHVKILMDLGYDPWEIENDADMLSVLKAAINDLTRTNPKDGRISQLQDAVKALRKPKFKEKKTRLDKDKVMGRKSKTEASPVDKGKVMNRDMAGPKDLEKLDQETQGVSDAKIVDFLNLEVKSRLDDINNSLGNILKSLKDREASAEARDDDMREAINTAKKSSREDKLESKGKGLKDKFKDKIMGQVEKTAGNFFMKILKFALFTWLGSAVVRLITLIKDPAVLLDPIKKFFNAFIGFQNFIMKSMWSITGAPINNIIKGIESGANFVIESINKATSLLFLPPIPSVKLPKIPGPFQIPFIPLSKTAQAAGGGIDTKGTPLQGASEGGIVAGKDGIDGVDGLDAVQEKDGPSKDEMKGKKKDTSSEDVSQSVTVEGANTGGVLGNKGNEAAPVASDTSHFGTTGYRMGQVLPDQLIYNKETLTSTLKTKGGEVIKDSETLTELGGSIGMPDLQEHQTQLVESLRQVEGYEDINFMDVVQYPDNRGRLVGMPPETLFPIFNASDAWKASDAKRSEAIRIDMESGTRFIDPRKTAKIVGASTGGEMPGAEVLGSHSINRDEDGGVHTMSTTGGVSGGGLDETTTSTYTRTYTDIFGNEVTFEESDKMREQITSIGVPDLLEHQDQLLSEIHKLKGFESVTIDQVISQQTGIPQKELLPILLRSDAQKATSDKKSKAFKDDEKARGIKPGAGDNISANDEVGRSLAGTMGYRMGQTHPDQLIMSSTTFDSSSKESFKTPESNLLGDLSDSINVSAKDDGTRNTSQTLFSETKGFAGGGVVNAKDISAAGGGKVESNSGIKIKGMGPDTQLLAAKPGESVLQPGVREQILRDTGKDVLAYNKGPNANRPTVSNTNNITAASTGGTVTTISNRDRSNRITAASTGGIVKDRTLLTPKVTRMNVGGLVPAPYPEGDNILNSYPMMMGYKGGGDVVNAKLTPGEIVMNEMQQRRMKKQSGFDPKSFVPPAQPGKVKFTTGGVVAPGADVGTPVRKGDGGRVIINQGNKTTPSPVASGGSGGGDTVPNISSTDPNNMIIPVIKSIYNIMG